MTRNYKLTPEKKGTYIAMDCCPLCRKERGIAIDTWLKDTFTEQKVVTSFYLCDECVKKLTEEDLVCMYECTGIDPKKGPKLTGRYIIVRGEPCRNDRITKEQLNFLNENRISFCDQEFYEKITKHYEEVRNGKEKESKSE